MIGHMKVIVLLNRGAGTVVSATAAKMDAAAADAMTSSGIAADLRSVSHYQLAAEAKAAAGSDADVVVAGGGDGTVNTVAAALAGTGKPLGVLALGTLNHFARDLGIPLDLASAAAIIAAGHTEPTVFASRLGSRGSPPTWFQQVVGHGLGDT